MDKIIQLPLKLGDGSNLDPKLPTSEEVNKNIESKQYNHSIKTSLQAETSRVSGVLKFKAIKAKVDCRGCKSC